MKTVSVTAYLVFLSFFTIFVKASVAQDVDFQFAESLFREGDYSRSITEAKRFIFKNPDSSYKEKTQILIADAYAATGNIKEALKQYDYFISTHPSSPNMAEVLYKTGKLYADNRKYPEAGQFFDKAQEDSTASLELHRKAIYWLFLVKLLADDPSYKETAANLSDDADKVALDAFQEKYTQLPFKSPVVAGTLAAIVPGAGHLYVGRNRDAFAALLLNGLFIWGMVESFRKDETGVGVTLSIFEIGWYAGNIYSAVNSAHKYNRRLKDSFKLGFTIDSNILSSRPNGDERMRIALNATF